MDFLTEKLGAIAGVMNSNKYLTAVKESFTATVGLIIIGSMGLLVGQVICGANGIGGFIPFLQQFGGMWNHMNNCGTGSISLFVAYNLGYNLSKLNGKPDFEGGLFSLMCYFLVNEFSITVDEVSFSGWHTDVVGAKGLIVAMLVCLVATEFYCKLQDVDALKITLPDSVPPTVSKSFSSLFPGMIVAFACVIINNIFKGIVGMTLPAAIYKVLAVPVMAVFELPIGVILCAFIANTFWICGLHGASIVGGVTDAFTLAALAENADLVAKGEADGVGYKYLNESGKIYTKSFWSTFATLGGSGCTLPLIACVFMFSKREDLKAICKLAIAPGIFEINEPIIFGVPIVMNPIMAIPFILGPMVSCGIGYAATALGICRKTFIQAPWIMPPLINGFLNTGGDIMICLVQLVCLVAVFFIWLPFVLISNNQEA
ncbi:MAG: PTS sugar transporter subunit IIC [Erysipelotrichaceae bacterium]|nr:PTS sugar transporter subunit IIC [Erysipelotrichaceae bacterium]